MGKYVVFYLFVGGMMWVLLPTMSVASGKRPKFWKCVVSWGPAALLGGKCRDWLWRE